MWRICESGRCWADIMARCDRSRPMTCETVSSRIEHFPRSANRTQCGPCLSSRVSTTRLLSSSTTKKSSWSDLQWLSTHKNMFLFRRLLPIKWPLLNCRLLKVTMRLWSFSSSMIQRRAQWDTCLGCTCARIGRWVCILITPFCSS